MSSWVVGAEKLNYILVMNREVDIEPFGFNYNSLDFICTIHNHSHSKSLSRLPKMFVIKGSSSTCQRRLQ